MASLKREEPGPRVPAGEDRALLDGPSSPDPAGDDLRRAALGAVGGLPRPWLEAALDDDLRALGEGLGSRLGELLPGHEIVELSLAGVVGGALRRDTALLLRCNGGQGLPRAGPVSSTRL